MGGPFKNPAEWALVGTCPKTWSGVEIRDLGGKDVIGVEMEGREKDSTGCPQRFTFSREEARRA